MTKPIFFGIRHGETASNDENVYRGWSNAPEAQLSEDGRKAVHEAGTILRNLGYKIDGILCDDLDRTKETAKIMAEELGLTKDDIWTVPNLKPLNVGDFTGKPKHEYPLDEYLKNTKKKIPGGDSIDIFDKRQIDTFSKILDLIIESKKLYLVVMHGSNISFLSNHLVKTQKKVGYEGLVRPGGLVLVSEEGIKPFTKIRSELPIEYPKDHEAGMIVPKGGSSCKTCEYLKDAGKEDIGVKPVCTNTYFIKWNKNSNIIPGPIDSYCSDFYEPKDKSLVKDIKPVKTKEEKKE